MEGDDILKAAELAARSARKWAMLALLIAVVFVALTVIDNGIKRDVIRSVREARGTLDDFKATAREVVNGSSARTPPAGDSGPDLPADGVVHAAGASAPPRRHAGRARTAPRGGQAGPEGGPGGDE